MGLSDIKYHSFWEQLGILFRPISNSLSYRISRIKKYNQEVIEWEEEKRRIQESMRLKVERARKERIK